MNIIASADPNWGIGYQGELLLRIPADMKAFKTRTTGHVVVMGRGTFDSLPGRKPLPDRVNMVLSGTLKQADHPGVQVFSSQWALLEELKKYDSQEVYVIGGESIFTLMLPYCRTAYITKLSKSFKADTYLMNLDEMPEWQIVEQSEEYPFEDGTYSFVTYKRL